MSRPVLAGIGSIGFTVLTIIGLAVANPAGGNYKASDVAKYVSGGHHVAAFVALYLLLLAVLGLLAVISFLRDVVAVSPSGLRIDRAFGWLGFAGAISFAIGWAIVLGDAIAHAYGGRHVVVATTVTYLVSELGFTVIFGPGAILLGFALITLALGTAGRLPALLRIASVIGGLGGILGPAFFPSVLVLAWGLVIGTWLILAGRRNEFTATTAPRLP